jgi:hypothetical protein
MPLIIGILTLIAVDGDPAQRHRGALASGICDEGRQGL